MNEKIKEALNNGYFTGRLEIRSNIVNSLKKDYITLGNMTKKPFLNPIKYIKIKEAIKVKEEILGLSSSF